MNKPDKGKKGGSCNVTACQKAGADYYNKSTKAYYCGECSEHINWRGGRPDVMELYGVPFLCEYEGRNDPRFSLELARFQEFRIKWKAKGFPHLRYGQAFHQYFQLEKMERQKQLMDKLYELDGMDAAECISRAFRFE